jgi:hypothetical protein
MIWKQVPALLLYDWSSATRQSRLSAIHGLPAGPGCHRAGLCKGAGRCRAGGCGADCCPGQAGCGSAGELRRTLAVLFNLPEPWVGRRAASPHQMLCTTVQVPKEDLAGQAGPDPVAMRTVALHAQQLVASALRWAEIHSFGLPDRHLERHCYQCKLCCPEQLCTMLQGPRWRHGSPHSSAGCRQGRSHRETTQRR